MKRSIDCVVVGYNDTAIEPLLKQTVEWQNHSGGYRHLLANSVDFRGRRIKYPELLNTAYSEATGTHSDFHVGKLPNLGVCYLVSFLRARGIATEFVNFFNAERDWLREVLAEGPLCVAITTTFYFEPEPIKEIVAFVRTHSTSTKIIVGGPHIYNVCADYSPDTQDSLLAAMGADIYVHDSQGELTLSRLCTALRQGDQINTIPNVISTKDGKTFNRGPREPEDNDMNANVVNWSHFDPSFLAPTVQTRTARSCAYRCAFCRYPVMAGNLDLVDVATVERDLRFLHSIGVRQLLFIDDTFNIPLGRFKDMCRMMIRNAFGFRWYSYFRCANADTEAFELMAEAGCKGVFLGIESGDDRVLRAMNKVATVQKYARGIEQLKSRDILTYASFIIGHPGETEETAAATIAFIDDVRPSFYCLETFYFDHKVPIAQRAADYALTGSAYSWQHCSMDWRMACDIVEEGYHRISGSIMCPLYSFDLWSIAYLLGQGFTDQQVKGFLQVAAEMVLGGIRAEWRARPDCEARLLSVFGEPRVLSAQCP